MAKSSKLADIQVGRVVEIAATGGKKPVVVQVTDVIRFTNDIKVSGFKLTKAGATRPGSRVHTFEVEEGRFLVRPCDAAAPAPVAVEAQVTAETETVSE